jgi:hypothetical protein
VQRVSDRVELTSHPEAFHEAPGRDVVGEAGGNDASQPQVLEAEPDELASGLGSVAPPDELRVEDPRQLRCVWLAEAATSACAQASSTRSIRSPMT